MHKCKHVHTDAHKQTNTQTAKHTHLHSHTHTHTHTHTHHPTGRAEVIASLWTAMENFVVNCSLFSVFCFGVSLNSGTTHSIIHALLAATDVCVCVCVCVKLLEVTRPGLTRLLKCQIY